MALESSASLNLCTPHGDPARHRDHVHDLQLLQCLDARVGHDDLLEIDEGVHVQEVDDKQLLRIRVREDDDGVHVHVPNLILLEQNI